MNTSTTVARVVPEPRLDSVIVAAKAASKWSDSTIVVNGTNTIAGQTLANGYPVYCDKDQAALAE
ncbi:MAG TPA: hypothetical protein ENF86_00085 [Firmicutes bacterium]|nr:hypothetical protein [Bacillota bacterium]